MKLLYILSALLFCSVVLFNTLRPSEPRAHEHVIEAPPVRLCQKAEALKREIKLLEIEIRTK